LADSRSDEQLMSAYVAGDSAAFRVIFERYAPLLTRAMLRELYAREEASDLVQQTFLQLHRARKDFDPGQKLKPWIFTIALNLKREHFRRRQVVISKEYPGVASETAMERARELAADLTKDFLDGKVDKVIVVFNEFKSAISQVVTFAPLLPIRATELPQAEGRIDFEYEPSKADVLSTLVPLYIEIELYRVMLESIASEFGARLSAMDNATKNAKEMIGSLTLQFNRARQAAITKELMEIVGGAEALKG